MPSTTARLFFALWPDEPMQAALAAAVVATDARPHSRAVPAKNFHLTLAFLGAVPQSRFEALGQVAAQCALAFGSRAAASSAGGTGSSPGASEAPIAITLDTLEHWRKPQILCATASQPPLAAVELAESLQRSLTGEGFTPDLKPFRVHATVARKVRRVSRELHIEPVRWSFREFHLVESQTGPEGSSYSTLKKWALDKCD